MLLDHGHPFAREYPIGMMMDESGLVEERLNSHIVTDAKLIRMAIGAALSDDANKLFDKELTKLHIKSIPHPRLFEE